MCVCACGPMRMCVHVHGLCAHGCVCVCACVFMCVQVRAYMRGLVRVYTHTCVHVCVWAYVHTHLPSLEHVPVLGICYVHPSPPGSPSRCLEESLLFLDRTRSLALSVGSLPQVRSCRRGEGLRLRCPRGGLLGAGDSSVSRRVENLHLTAKPGPCVGDPSAAGRADFTDVRLNKARGPEEHFPNPDAHAGHQETGQGCLRPARDRCPWSPALPALVRAFPWLVAAVSETQREGDCAVSQQGWKTRSALGTDPRVS